MSISLLDIPTRWLPNHRTLGKKTKFFRLFESRDGDPITLFHGNDGKRSLETDTRLVSDTIITYDGSGGSRYVSGWHLVRTYKECWQYLQKFSADRKLVICPVFSWGVVWEKSHSPSDILLSKNMKIQSWQWNDAKENHSFNPSNL